ncbi:MAG TPA: CBS domain-containing protein [Noviherbaspirillum sp.]|uniref:CBS domain-containing protein n=1 Tax=Noviherbaspirillum sp. TaxID=1926288 RepID=UPI002F95A339
MQRIAEVMTRDVRSVTPQETIRRAAEMMDELNVGALPVCDGERLVGMITDRDITVRAVAAGVPPDTAQVGEVMSVQVRWCFEDQPVDEVMQQMADTQIRRVPVVDQNTHSLIGIVSLGDLATKHSAQVDRTLEGISSPSEPDRSRLAH